MNFFSLEFQSFIEILGKKKFTVPQGPVIKWSIFCVLTLFSLLNRHHLKCTKVEGRFLEREGGYPKMVKFHCLLASNSITYSMEKSFCLFIIIFLMLFATLFFLLL